MNRATHTSHVGRPSRDPRIPIPRFPASVSGYAYTYVLTCVSARPSFPEGLVDIVSRAAGRHGRQSPWDAGRHAVAR